MPVFLKLTNSNLLPPTGKMEEHITEYDDGESVIEYLDGTEKYKPVVWLTREDEPQTQRLGLYDKKTEVRITLEKKSDYEPWVLFADKNRMNRTWRKKLEYGRNPFDWYVCEHTIPISDFLEVRNRVTNEIIEVKGQS